MSNRQDPTKRLDWRAVLDEAKSVVLSYDTGVTLRQLHYRLVSTGTIPNTASAYKQLSGRTAEARRAGDFPDLIDRTRSILRPPTWEDPGDALDWLANTYRRDRTEGQARAVYLGVEKAGMVEQLRRWFDDLGVPILPLGGYASQSFKGVVTDDLRSDGRPSVLIYGGDFDPSGEDIERDFTRRTPFDEVVRVALTSEQVVEYRLPPQPGKASDPRADGFVARHGELVQVELDALPPDVLRDLYRREVDRHVDTSILASVLEREERERREMEAWR